MSRQSPLRRTTRQEPQWRQEAWPVMALSRSPWLDLIHLESYLTLSTLSVWRRSRRTWLWSSLVFLRELHFLSEFDRDRSLSTMLTRVQKYIVYYFHSNTLQVLKNRGGRWWCIRSHRCDYEVLLCWQGETASAVDLPWHKYQNHGYNLWTSNWRQLRNISLEAMQKTVQFIIYFYPPKQCNDEF